MQQDILHVFIELVVLYIMYKTKIIYKFTFYMKLMTASCSMSKFSAYSHNFQINNNFRILHLHVCII